MPFAFYSRLSRAQQRVYRQSDEIGTVTLPGAADLRPRAEVLERALGSGDRVRTEVAGQALVDGLTTAFRVPPMRVEVKGVRPARNRGELHGLYTPSDRGRRPLLSLWMRTAQRGQVVAFRTFLRTLVHEVCHHLDYELLKLSDSFHTQGFYRRESSILRQLLNEGITPMGQGPAGEERILSATERPVPPWRKGPTTTETVAPWQGDSEGKNGSFCIPEKQGDG